MKVFRARVVLDGAGQSPFPPTALLKLCLYGYFNRVRSSRALEKGCQRNPQAIWVAKGLLPGYKTHCRLPQAQRQAHARFIGLCKDLGLLGGRRVGVDGSHFTGNVSDKSFRSVKGLAHQAQKK